MSKKPEKSTKSSSSTKTEKILKLMQCRLGATAAELAKAGGWQHHCIQGFMSGTLSKKRGLEIKSVKTEQKDRRYFIAEKP